jgi:hypothetical protein
MRLPDLLEAKHGRQLCFETACRHLLCDFLERHVGQRETRSAEYTKLPKKVR